MDEKLEIEMYLLLLLRDKKICDNMANWDVDIISLCTYGQGQGDTNTNHTFLTLDHRLPL